VVVDRGTLVRCRMTRPSTSAVLPTVTAAVPRTHPQLEAVLTQEAGLDGNGRLRMPTAALACLPSALLICSGSRLVWTLTPACLRRAAAQPRRKQS
jgi:hypothetical protein